MDAFSCLVNCFQEIDRTKDRDKRILDRRLCVKSQEEKHESLCFRLMSLCVTERLLSIYWCTCVYILTCGDMALTIDRVKTSRLELG